MATRGQNSLPNSSGESFDPDLENNSKMASFEVTNVWQSFVGVEDKMPNIFECLEAFNDDYTFSSIIYDHHLLNHMK